MNLTPSTSRHDTVGIFGVVKIEIIAPVEGKKWPIGHTVLVDDQSGQQLIDEGVAIIHPTVSDPGPTHPCPCEDETAEPCEECQEKAKAMDVPDAAPVKPKRERRKAKSTTSNQ